MKNSFFLISLFSLSFSVFASTVTPDTDNYSKTLTATQLSALNNAEAKELASSVQTYKIEIISSSTLNKQTQTIFADTIKLLDNTPTPFNFMKTQAYLEHIQRTDKGNILTPSTVTTGASIVLLADSKTNSIHYKVKYIDLNGVRSTSFYGNTDQKVDTSTYKVDKTSHLTVGSSIEVPLVADNGDLTKVGQIYTLKLTRLN